MTPEQHLRRAEVLERSTSPKAKELAQHHRNLAKLIQHRQDRSRPAHAEGVGPINSPACMELAYEQARQQLVGLGRQEPKGDAYPKCLFDGLVALSGAFPLFLLTGRSPEDLAAMWAVVVGVGIISYAIRYYLEQAWWRDLEQRAKLIAGLLTIEELRDWERSRKSSSHD
jgi:hypothetical protein